MSLVIVVLLAFVASAGAAPPLQLDSGLITDDAQVLGSDTTQVEAALDQLNADRGVQLFVVFVNSFDGTNSQDWADETADINGLGLNDMLLAVAVEDHQYAWSVDEDFPLSDGQLWNVATMGIEPALQDADWAGAVIAAAQGYNAALADTPIADGTAPADANADGAEPAEESGGASIFSCVVPGALLLVVVGAVLFFVSKRKGKGAGTSAPAAPAAPGAAPAQPDMKSLETQAGQLLVEVDDALRTSEEELGFAEAEFGTTVVAEYSAALAQSKNDVAEAFRIQQKVYDAEPEDEATRRSMLEKIIELAEGADERLDEKAEGFASLRDVAKRVGDVLGTVEERLKGVEAGLAGAAATITELKAAYDASALGEVADDDIQAAALVPVARDAIAQAREADAKGDSAAAAIAAREAEDAVAQAERLLAAISSAKERLDKAKADLTGELTALEQAAAAAEAQGSAQVAPLMTMARQAASQATAALAGATMDPVAELEKVRSVQDQLQQASGAVRDASQAASNAISTARERVGSVEAYVQTRRAAVGTQARAALTEANRRLTRAQDLLASDPEAANAEAQAALQYAESATRYAQGDVTSYERARTASAPPPSGNMGAAAAGAVLGSVLRGGAASRAKPSGPSQASFGGLGRRSSGGAKKGKSGRRGGGGRF